MVIAEQQREAEVEFKLQDLFGFLHVFTANTAR